ncbi:hypothetical protein B0H14DRAFT_3446238 [Mycena olivaceomarginata]|nr:hypothetical protein B0H14DRAFT_3446238 [Mycena olivaceomarginata]
MATYDDRVWNPVFFFLSAPTVFVTQFNAFQYFLLCPTDMIYRKSLVLSTVFFCTVALVADYANVYMVENLWISILMSLLLITGLAGSFMVAITLQEISFYTSRDKAKTAALVWTISTAATDMVIAGALIWQLFSMKSRCSLKDTHLIKRLIIQTVQTGSTTSVVSIITLVSYLLNNDSNVPTACNFLIAPLYVLTLLSNFNLRRRDTISGSGRSASEGNAGRIYGIHFTVNADPTDREVS